jgi:AraC family transcriptional regulator
MGTNHHHLVASGPDWRASEFTCSMGPHDPAFEERHAETCIALVLAGTFQYRSAQGTAVLSPGAILLGNAETRFECSHEHAAGDRCLSFHFAPDCLESVADAVPGARRITFDRPSLPALPALMPLIAAAQAASEGSDSAEIEELALRIAGAVAATLAASGRPAREPSRRDAHRITRALRLIEMAEPSEPLALANLARAAAMSPYHFLRTFRQVAGMTPHQYVLRTRLHRAAVRVLASRAPISTIAFEAGFNDLSTFNHRFRRLMGVTPSDYRARSAASR